MKRTPAINWLLVLCIGLTALIVACAPAAAPTSVPTSPPTAAKAPATTAPATTPTSAPAAQPTAAPKAQATPRPLAKTKAGMNRSTSNTPFWIGIEKGYYKEIGLELELVNLQTGTDMIAPMSSGEMWIGSGQLSAAHFNAVARGVPIKLVMPSNTTQPAFDSVGFLVRKSLIDSGRVKDFKDLKGLTIAIAAPGSVAEFLTIRLLEKGGLKPSDVNMVVIASQADQMTAFANGSLDVANIPEPYITAAEDQGIAKMFKMVGDVVMPFQYGGNSLSPFLWKEKPELAQDYVVAHLRAIRDYADAMGPKKKDREAVLNIMTKYSDIKDVKLLDRIRPAGVAPDGLSYLENLDMQLQFYISKGLVPNTVKITDLVDNSLAEKAVAKLGKYQP